MAASAAPIRGYLHTPEGYTNNRTSRELAVLTGALIHTGKALVVGVELGIPITVSLTVFAHPPPYHHCVTTGP